MWQHHNNYKQLLQILSQRTILPVQARQVASNLDVALKFKTDKNEDPAAASSSLILLDILIKTNMWKKVGSVQSGEDKSIRSNKSRIDVNPEPFHQSIKRRSNISPETNRSFCYDYFEKKRNNTLNMTIQSNKSEKDIRGPSSKEDIFTEIRNRASKDDIGSRIDSVKENPEGESSKKGREGLRQAASRLHNLKKQQSRLRQMMEREFNGFKNFFYQIQEKLYSSMNETQLSVESKGADGIIDDSLVKDILGEALDVERFFCEMDRKKVLIMQELSE